MRVNRRVLGCAYLEIAGRGDVIATGDSSHNGRECPKGLYGLSMMDHVLLPISIPHTEHAESRSVEPLAKEEHRERRCKNGRHACVVFAHVCWEE